MTSWKPTSPQRFWRGALILALLAGPCWLSCGGGDPSADAGLPDSEIPGDADTPAFEFPARVLRVIDGDTIEVRFREVELTIRLLGVDTPELNPIEEPWAEEARQFTIQYATPGLTVGLEFEDSRCGSIPFPDSCFDIYDRMLAYIRTPGDYDLNALLVANGLAEVYQTGDFMRKTEYLALQEEAQRQALGIWSQ